MNPNQYLAEPYEVKIDFERRSENPSRIFTAMSDLVIAFERIDRDLVYPFDARIEPRLLLEDIKSGSLRSFLRNAISGLDDEALKAGDWNKVLGRYLLHGKYALLKFLEDRKEITDREEVLELEAEITKLAEAADIKRIPAYTPIPTRVLLYDIGQVTKALGHLSTEDKAVYLYADKAVVLNQSFSFNQEAVEDLLTKETKVLTEDVTVQVKKPDYLGNSMWDLKFRDHVVSAKIEDRVWLERFQNRVVDVRPGDGLNVTIQTEVSYGYQGEEVAIHYTVKKVHKIVSLPAYEKQLGFE